MQEVMMRNIFEGKNLGADMAQKMIDKGALDLLKRAEENAFKDEMPQRL